jgi:hypothetical protein
VRAFVNKHIPRGDDGCLVWGTIGWAIPLSRYPDTYTGQSICHVALSLDMGKCCVHFETPDDFPKDPALLVKFFQAGSVKLVSLNSGVTNGNQQTLAFFARFFPAAPCHAGAAIPGL